MGEPPAPPAQRHRILQLSKAHSDLVSLRDGLSKGWHFQPQKYAQQKPGFLVPGADSCLHKPSSPAGPGLPSGEGGAPASACMAPLPAGAEVSGRRGRGSAVVEQPWAPAGQFPLQLSWLRGPELWTFLESHEGFSEGEGPGQPPLRLSWDTQLEGLQLCGVSCPQMSNGARAGLLGWLWGWGCGAGSG